MSTLFIIKRNNKYNFKVKISNGNFTPEKTNMSHFSQGGKKKQLVKFVDLFDQKNWQIF